MRKCKNILFLVMRIIILIGVSYVILLCINKLLFLKHNKKNEEWNYHLETQKINQMIEEKNYEYGTEYFPILLDKKNTISPKDNKKRILVIGDSFVWGYANTNINRLYYKRLYQLFKENGYNDIEIIAAGYYGFNTEDEYNYIINNEKLMKAIDPDLVIITYVPNDPEIHGEGALPLYSGNITFNYGTNAFFKKKFPDLCNELEKRLTADMTDDYDFLKFIGKYIGYRWDIYRDLITSDENLEHYYKDIVFNVDKKLKEYNIPYFYYFEDTILYAKRGLDSNLKVAKYMKKNWFPFYYNFLDCIDYVNNLYNQNKINNTNTSINPADSHPNDILTNFFGNDVYKILKTDYNFIFPEKKNVNLPLKINDTFPNITVNQNDNKFTFTYPNVASKQSIYSNYLYFPLNKDYVKLNLEFPKYIKEIKVRTDDGNIEVYLNTIDEETGLDLNAFNLEFYKPIKISKNTYKVNKKVSSINIAADFDFDLNKNIEIEIIE